MANLERLFELTKLCQENDAKLVVVSKTQSASEIMEVYQAGHRSFGENRVHELVEKHRNLPPDIEWHMIGHLQRNKVKEIVPFISLIQSVDSFRLAVEISRQAEKAGRTIPVLIQVHIASESSKYGFAMEELRSLLENGTLQALPDIQFLGVMGMATFTDDADRVRSEFRYLHACFEELRSKWFPGDENGFRQLSMGMTGDYAVALEEGSTMVRIGSAIFGPREVIEN